MLGTLINCVSYGRNLSQSRETKVRSIKSKEFSFIALPQINKVKKFEVAAYVTYE